MTDRVIGFTGTEYGMSRAQKTVFAHLIKSGGPIYSFHHGDCIGADEESHNIMRRERPSVIIQGHPPKNPKARAFCKCDYLWPEEDYLVRNQIIVNNSREMIATPREFKEVLRSGTWATIRRARKAELPLTIIFPDGTRKGHLA